MSDGPRYRAAGEDGGGPLWCKIVYLGMYSLVAPACALCSLVLGNGGPREMNGSLRLRSAWIVFHEMALDYNLHVFLGMRRAAQTAHSPTVSGHG